MMQCVICGVDFSPDEIMMILVDGEEPICDLCAVQTEKMNM